MHIDISALRMIEADKGIPIDTVIETIETALLTAYKHTAHPAQHARIDINRKSGEVRVMAHEYGPNGEASEEWDDTPDDFGRIAATDRKSVV